MTNPFFFGGRITDPRHFAGREKELRFIFSALETAHSGQLQHVQVVGERRIGKSSLLYHLTQIYAQRLSQPQKYRFVYVDLDDSRCHTLEGLLGFILKGLGISHANHPTLAQFQRALEEFGRERGQYPVLCLDEFEHLTKRREQFPNEVFEVWRSLGSGNSMAFITASQTPLAKLIQQGNLTSTFHNIFTYLSLGNFTESEARSLLARSLDRPFTEAEQKKLIELAGYHPAHLQIAARLLYEAKGNPPVDWKSLQADYREHLRNIQPVKPPQAGPAWYAKVLTAVFIVFPTALGHFVLEIFKNKDASDRTAAILGWVILGVIILSLLGVLSLSDLLPWLRLLRSSSF